MLPSQLTQLNKLKSLGVSSKKWRYYYWATHFIETGDMGAADFFVSLLYKQTDWVMPLSWDELDSATKSAIGEQRNA